MSNNIYFNARARALEAKILSFQTLEELAKCSAIVQVERILNDARILKGTKAETFLDFLRVVDSEEKQFFEFLKRSSPNENIAKYFLLKNDYFNFEAMFLNTRLNKDLNYVEPGFLQIQTLQKCFETNNFSNLSHFQQTAQKLAQKLCDENKHNGFLIDTIFKQAYFEEKLELSKSDKILFDFQTNFVDLKNIELCFKLRDFNLFLKTKLCGGTLSNDFLKTLCTESFENILFKAKKFAQFEPIKLLVDAKQQNTIFGNFETLVDCFAITYFDGFKYRTDKNYEYLRYCFLKENELKNLRIIFNGLFAKRSHKKICEDLGRVYEK